MPLREYIEKLHRVSSIEEGYKILIDSYGSEKYKPFLYSTDDTFEGYVDEWFNELKDKFLLFQCRKVWKSKWIYE